MSLWLYVVRRLVLMVPVIVGILFVTFSITHLIPRNPVYALVGSFADEQLVRDTIERLGLDQPLTVQFSRYVGNLARGDLGTSIRTGRPVLEEIVHRLPATLELTTSALVLAVVGGVLLGTYAALHRGRAADHVTRALVLAGNSLPDFWLGLIVMFVFYLVLGWAPPPTGRLDSGLVPPPAVSGFYVLDALLAADAVVMRSALGHLALPALTLAVVVMAPIARVVRANMIEALNSPFVRCAEAHGLRPRRILYGYAFRNAMLPLVSLIAIVYGNLLGGAVMVEAIYAWPGLGQWAVDGIQAQDYPAVQAFVLMTALFYMAVYLVTDVIVAMLDPRIRY